MPENYFEKISQSVSSILNQESISDKDEHKVRKLLKDLSYHHKEIEKLDDNGFALSEYYPNDEDFDQLLEELETIWINVMLSIYLSLNGSASCRRKIRNHYPG